MGADDTYHAPCDRPLSICIVSHNGYGAISGGSHGFIGGVEWQTCLLARWLQARGHRVSYLTWNEGGPAEENIDGIRVIKICDPNAGLPGLRFFHPKWSSLLSALHKANAEVYYHNCGDCVTGQTAAWCGRNSRPFVFSAASDADCDAGLPELRSFRERWLYLHGLRKAARVVVQTRTQQDMLSKNFQVSARVIPIAAPEPSGDRCQPPSPTSRRVLWVGRVCKVKRPDRLIAIAKACPDLNFEMIGPVYDDPYSRSVEAQARSLPNVTVRGAVPRDGMRNLYQGASVLCCTSDYEGFPNTFLEAWSNGLPVVSTVDPDGVIARNNLGRVASCTESLATSLRGLLADSQRYGESSQAARNHFIHHHSMDSVMPRMETLLASVIPTRSRPCIPS